MLDICMFYSTAISIHMLIQTRMILAQNSNAPGVAGVNIVGKCCWTKSSWNLFNNIYYTWNVVEQNRLDKESIAPFQRSDIPVFADLFWNLRLVPLDFQRWEICWKITLWIAWFCPYSPYFCKLCNRNFRVLWIVCCVTPASSGCFVLWRLRKLCNRNFLAVGTLCHSLKKWLNVRNGKKSTSGDPWYQYPKNG